MALSWVPLAGLALAGCVKPPAPKAESPPAPVLVAVAEKRTVPIQIRTIGAVKAISTVALRPQVGGQLTGVLFKEGDVVHKNQELFTIDPRPYHAAVKLAQANLAKDKALQRRAEQELARTEVLWKRGAETDANMEAARTAFDSARATVDADEAALTSAQIQAGFTTIASPLDGRIGELLVSRGNLVEANGATPLAIVNQISPIHVTFAVPEQQLPAVAAAQRKQPLKVQAFLRNGETSVAGVLGFIDNAVTTGTGTVHLKAEFANGEQQLWPGQFVDVVLTLGERPGSVVVPPAAVQTGQQGTFVFVVTPEKTVQVRPVVVAFEAGESVVILTGLHGGETVVTDGQIRLTNGTRVAVKTPAVANGPAERAVTTPATTAGGGAQ